MSQESKPFNPLDKKNLGISVADALLAQPVLELPLKDPFIGAGIYALYYHGDFPAYAYVAERNREAKFRLPIYVGKAVPTGARRGAVGLDVPAGKVLYNRLQEHSESIAQAKNLDIAHFTCRFLIVEDIWIPLGESLLISTLQPIWNVVIDGYGNHDPGAGRYKQRQSPWDVLHPGRGWAKRCAKSNRTESEFLEMIAVHFEKEKTKRSEQEKMVIAID